MRRTVPLTTSLKQFLLVGGDLIVLYGALWAALALRDVTTDVHATFGTHVLPFSILFVLWIGAFYVAGLYDLPRLRNNLGFIKTIAVTIAVNIGIGIAFFYTLPIWGIAPKTTLLIFAVIFVIPAILWRRFFNRLIAGTESNVPICIIGSNAIAEKLYETFAENPQLGYRVIEKLDEHEVAHLRADTLAAKGVRLVVLPRAAKYDAATTKQLYQLLVEGVQVRDLGDLYEEIFRKVPLEDIDEAWLLENISRPRQFSDEITKFTEWIVAAVALIILLPLGILIGLAVKLTSRGPIIYKHVRTGRNGKPFTLYKFRSMVQHAEKNGPQWSTPNDPRVTPVGRVLRTTHLDELPQLINVVLGSVSFVGPRPERPEIDSMLAREIPYYRIRHLVTPGLSGWAQINFKYGSSTDDARHKLQYDLFYIKNRSLILDVAIIVKTVRTLFDTPR